MPRIEHVTQRVVVEQPTAGAVHQNRTRRHQGQLAGPDQSAVLGRLPGMDRDDRRLGEQRVQILHPLDATRQVDAQIGVVHHHPGSERHHDRRHPRTDRPITHQPDRRPGDLGTYLVVEVVVAAPFAGHQLGVPLRDLPDGGHDHRDRVLGRRGRVATGGEREQDAVLGRRVGVRIHRPAPADGDHCQVRGRRQHLLRDRLGVREAHIAAAQRLDEAFLVALRLADAADVAHRLERPLVGQAHRLGLGQVAGQRTGQHVDRDESVARQEYLHHHLS